MKSLSNGTKHRASTEEAGLGKHGKQTAGGTVETYAIIGAPGSPCLGVTGLTGIARVVSISVQDWADLFAQSAVITSFFINQGNQKPLIIGNHGNALPRTALGASRAADTAIHVLKYISHKNS